MARPSKALSLSCIIASGDIKYRTPFGVVGRWSSPGGAFGGSAGIDLRRLAVSAGLRAASKGSSPPEQNQTRAYGA
ncbi:hypothetical protein SFRURICE_006478 [Spodoptera frugiperda]|nr:hypothetical protein SFRURICE_006478 [Spodoptera frugiperda]